MGGTKAKAPALRPPLSNTSPASSFHSDSHLKWKNRKRERNPKKKLHEDDEEDEEEDEAAAGATATGVDREDRDLFGIPQGDPVVEMRQSEVLSDGGRRISDFPMAFRRLVNRPHSSVVAIIEAERLANGQARPVVGVSLENVSHGQLQVLSAVSPDNPVLSCQTETEKSSPAYVCTPPQLMVGKGVAKRVAKRVSKDAVLVLPQHSDWFNPNSVHRLEKQVVPHFFSGKSAEQTPERYMLLRNKIVAKYMENPGRKLSLGECQGLVPSNELYDFSRIVRFLDHWGIINFLAVSKHQVSRVAGSLIREEASGELQVTSSPLKSIDSLVQFDRPRSSYSPEDISCLSSSTSKDACVEDSDLDGRIRERLSEHSCTYCSRPLPKMCYQSQKEVGTTLCSDCFHDGKYITGHSSLDFTRIDLPKDLCDNDGDSWSDQETFLLLEALEIYNDDWNEIAEHVGTKSKAQCITHFIRLPMEDSLFENIDFPSAGLKDNPNVMPNTKSNGHQVQDGHSGSLLPFANASNPVMSLVAFLAAAVGPRVAAACASAALSILTKEDSGTDWMTCEVAQPEDGLPGDHIKDSQQRGETVGNLELHKDGSSLSSKKVKTAAIFGLSAAAIKAKLFADQEEREIQRLTAAIINHQLKRLELKLRRFAEIETMLLKECENVERNRQRLSAERVRLASARFGQVGTTAASAPVPTAGNPNTRQESIISVGAHASNSPAYANNIQTHPHMSFMPRQPIHPFVGPRLPLSAIHPSSSPQSTNVMLTPGTSNAPTPNNHRSLLRSMSGNNTNLG